jgi:hypothetical protein
MALVQMAVGLVRENEEGDFLQATMPQALVATPGQHQPST